MLNNTAAKMVELLDMKGVPSDSTRLLGESLRGQTKGSTISGKMAIRVDGLEGQLIISLQLVSAKYTCSCGSEAPEPRSNASTHIFRED